jgi:hypothetical protein
VADERETRVDNATRLTGIPGAAERPELLQGDVELVPPPEPAPYVKEPLFSRRVMIGWAIGTLVVWFGLTVIVPAVIQSIKGAVVGTVPTDGTTRVIRTPNGTTITITGGPGGGVTVDRTRGTPAPEPGTRTIIAVPNGGAIAEPAPIAEPVPPREPTGKK